MQALEHTHTHLASMSGEFDFTYQPTRGKPCYGSLRPRPTPSQYYQNDSPYSSGEFESPAVVSPAPAIVIPPAMLEAIKASLATQAAQEAQTLAEQIIAQERAECDRKLQLARLRVAELEERTQKAEHMNDQTSMELTLTEIQKGEVEMKLKKAQEELAKNGDARREFEELKRTTIILSEELKRRMAEDRGEGESGVANEEEFKIAVYRALGSEGVAEQRMKTSSSEEVVEDTDYAASGSELDDNSVDYELEESSAEVC